ncbi:3-oxoacyl-ACP reductase FabG [Coxiella-like endosymbiont of Amblyomma americanum]|uniref:3-oxoacyl-ACP reductase FabG n=1 Tax=Coxiella-like endosymbiont of Amblyomma americanum TaxID=1987500 RepID=UPI000F89DAF8|nr:3-oxoacyl-ACP reductase FabG [Coxiella-like endosymbiont of Amblyomma americanum]AUJ58985.1 3-oxoacyl-ACP reductase [Coxiella-like endosymbiont of Amblyomma americanum]
MSLKGKVVLITGASRGIGLEIAKAFGLRGAVVLGTATSQEGAYKITQFLSKGSFKGRGYILNVCNQKEIIRTVLTQIRNSFDFPNILINNAGITKDNIILRMKYEEWKSVLETNLYGVFHLIKACLKPMIKNRWGRIINITSVVAITGNLGQANYVAAKSGLIGLTKVVAMEHAIYGITANCVAPGFIKTEMTEALSIEQQKSILSRVPMQRMGLPKEIAGAVVYLSSEEAGYITGETLHINGGMCMV